MREKNLYLIRIVTLLFLISSYISEAYSKKFCDPSIDASLWNKCIGRLSTEGLRSADGLARRYEGLFEKGKYHGEGTETWEDGTIFIGRWLEGKKHGDFTVRHSSGRTVEATYWEGNLSESRESSRAKVDLSEAQRQCIHLGFRARTEQFGECVLRISK
jgi:hypothetical protein